MNNRKAGTISPIYAQAGRTVDPPSLGLCWGSVPGGTLWDVARVAAAARYDCITLHAGLWQAAVADGTTPADISARLADMGIRVGVIDPLMAPLPGTPQLNDIPAGLAHFFSYAEEECFAIAENLGAPIVNIAHFLGDAATGQALDDSVAGIAERAAGRGLGITLEFIPGTGIGDLATAARMAGTIPNTRIMVDTWHLARSGGTPADLRALPAGLVGGVQLNDRILPPAGQPYVPMSGRSIPGEGALPLVEIVAALHANQPGLDMCVEVFSAEIEAMDRIEAALRMADGAREILSNALRHGEAG